MKTGPLFAWILALNGTASWCVPARAESTISTVPALSARAASVPTPTAADALREAESALQSVDYATVYARARRGLELGGATVRETARLNVLVGLSAALLGHSEEARVHFISALAIQPSLRLERELSPKMREPYLEALGYWGAQPTRLALSVKVDKQAGALSFHLDDPAQLSRHLTCFVRVGPGGTFAPQKLDARSRGRFDLPKEAKLQGFSYYLELTDVHGNRLLEQGSDDDPLHVAQLPIALNPTSTGETRISLAHEGRATPVLPIAMLSTGLVAVGAGIYFNVRRQNLAERWNGAECERPGQSRGEQCADVQRDRVNMERLAIAGYALGGALVTAGASLLYLGSTRETATRSSSAFGRCGITPLRATLYCQGRF